MPFFDVLDASDAFETADLPGDGDTNASGGAGGITTSSLTNENVLDAYGLDRSGGQNAGGPVDYTTGKSIGRHMTPQVAGNPTAEHPGWTVLLIIIILAFVKFGLRKGESEDTKNVKISIGNMFLITLMAFLGFLGAKLFFSIFVFSSISPTVEYV